MIRRPPISPPFPYTTLFRSLVGVDVTDEQDADEEEHLDEGEESQPLENDGPGIEEHRLDVEDQEEHRDQREADGEPPPRRLFRDRKSTRLNSSHANISYAVF